MSALEPPARQNQIPRGIFYMVISTVLFAGVNAIVKWEVALYHVGEVAFYRALFALVAVAVIVLPRTGIAVFRTRRYLAHLQRGISQFGSMTASRRSARCRWVQRWRSALPRRCSPPCCRS